MPPVSDKQRRFIFAKANQGIPWAKRYIAEAPTMKTAMRRMIRKKEK